MRFLILLLFPLSVLAVVDENNLPPIHPALKEAGAKWCWQNWYRPTERKNGVPLPLSEILTYNIKIYGVKWKGKVEYNDTHIRWLATSCPPCEAIEITTVDIDGRESIVTDGCHADPNAPVVCK